MTARRPLPSSRATTTSRSSFPRARSRASGLRASWSTRRQPARKPGPVRTAGNRVVRFWPNRVWDRLESTPAERQHDGVDRLRPGSFGLADLDPCLVTIFSVGALTNTYCPINTARSTATLDLGTLAAHRARSCRGHGVLGDRDRNRDFPRRLLHRGTPRIDCSERSGASAWQGRLHAPVESGRRASRDVRIGRGRCWPQPRSDYIDPVLSGKLRTGIAVS